MEVSSTNIDTFGGIHIRLAKTKINKKSIGVILKHLDTDDKKSIYLYIPESVVTSYTLKYLEKKGYKFHRYETTTRTFVYYLWIGEGVDKVPTTCTSILGAQTIVRNPRGDKVLMIKERTGKHILWKLPTGAIDLGESTVEGAIREAIEETGAKISDKKNVRFVGGYTSGNARPGGINNQFSCFEITADNMKLGKTDGEALSIKWVSRKNIETHFNKLTSKDVIDFDHHFLARVMIDGDLYQWLSLNFISTPRETQYPVRYYPKTNVYLFNGN